MNVIKAIYNFIVGDMIILIGVLALVLVVALLQHIAALTPLRGIILIVAVLGTLVASLSREAQGQRE
ncbi:MAG: hypothetical protein JO125_03350 [Chloroflexi bacterium]|nr:hypothetical protein [Ktedonobacteraceae bacterium]MBV8823346.1 hypothetical protein [Ktedonobacteraceae bacterium]MBV9021541.1 hypothetical protein [Ktedonobacteraceae bacterium]MBV9706426.1 hypothetical protein [Chloroflexota bacterium]